MLISAVTILQWLSLRCDDCHTVQWWLPDTPWVACYLNWEKSVYTRDERVFIWPWGNPLRCCATATLLLKVFELVLKRHHYRAMIFSHHNNFHFFLFRIFELKFKNLQSVIKITEQIYVRRQNKTSDCNIK